MALLVTIGLLVPAAGGQFFATAALAQTPNSSPTQVKIIVDGNAATVSTFSGGDTFEISVLAEAIPEPGIFGGQLELHFNPTHLAVIDDSLRVGPLLEPALVVQSKVDSTEGVAYFAASRQGNVDNLLGDVGLVNLAFETLAVTAPVTSSITLKKIRLGAKGGAAMPANEVFGLDIYIEPAPAASGNLAGQIMLEGRPGNQAAEVALLPAGAGSTQTSLPTEFDGSFIFKNLLPGLYTLTASSPGYLPATCLQAAHQSGQFTRLVDVTLLAGDINGDGEINIADAVAIGAGLNIASPDPTVDLNRDSAVDVLDLILMAANYGQSASGNPWKCQPDNGG